MYFLSNHYGVVVTQHAALRALGTMQHNVMRLLFARWQHSSWDNYSGLAVFDQRLVEMFH